MKILRNDKGRKSSLTHRRWFEKTYEEYFERLFRFAFTIVKDRQSAEDVVSEVFIDLWKMGIASSGIKDLDSYLFVSIKNRAIRQLTKNPFRFEQIDFERTIRRIDKLTPEMVIIEKEMLELIQLTINDLPEQCRLAYEFVKMKQLSYKEAAAELGISESTLHNQMVKSLKRLREALEAYLNEHNSYLRFIS